jgi:hypothetical protein
MWLFGHGDNRKIRRNGIIDCSVFMVPDADTQLCPVCNLYATAFAVATGTNIQIVCCGTDPKLPTVPTVVSRLPE